MNHPVLPVEYNPQDEILTLSAPSKIDTNPEMQLVRDGQEVLDYLPYTSIRQSTPKPPKVMRLGLNLPRVRGQGFGKWANGYFKLVRIAFTQVAVCRRGWHSTNEAPPVGVHP